jgi:hypothetical protein
MQKQLNTLVKESKGRFFSVTFTKKDGTVRTINGKDYYKSLLNGGTSKVAHLGYTSIVDNNRGGWAAVHEDKVLAFKCGTVCM